MYTAPEAIMRRWKEVAGVLYGELGNPPFASDWKLKLFDIWMDQ